MPTKIIQPLRLRIQTKVIILLAKSQRCIHSSEALTTDEKDGNKLPKLPTQNDTSILLDQTLLVSIETKPIPGDNIDGL